MPVTYDPIATITKSSESAGFYFASIPQTYTDLILIMSITKASANVANIHFRVNNDTSTNYSSTDYGYDGNSCFMGYSTNTSVGKIWQNSMSGTGDVVACEVHFMDYANTTKYKSVIARGNKIGTSGDTGASYLELNTWRSTAAISIIDIIDTSTRNYGIGSSATLYGVLRA